MPGLRHEDLQDRQAGGLTTLGRDRDATGSDGRQARLTAADTYPFGAPTTRGSCRFAQTVEECAGRMANPRPQKPLELILARNLLTSISTPAFLLDGEAAVVFYNEAAAALLGRSFEEAGRMEAEQWTAGLRSVRRRRPAGRGRRAGDHRGDPRGPARARDASRSGPRAGGEREIEASAFPIVASEHGSSGAMILFWPIEDANGAR